MEPLVFERLKTLLKPANVQGDGPRVAIRHSDRLRTLAAPPAPVTTAPAYAYPGYGYVSMALTCMEAIGLMTDITSMETASSAITELVRRGIHLEPIDWVLVEHCHGAQGEPIPTLAQIHAAFRERLVVLGFTAVNQAAAA